MRRGLIQALLSLAFLLAATGSAGADEHSLVVSADQSLRELVGNYRGLVPSSGDEELTQLFLNEGDFRFRIQRLTGSDQIGTESVHFLFNALFDLSQFQAARTGGMTQFLFDVLLEARFVSDPAIRREVYRFLRQVRSRFGAYSRERNEVRLGYYIELVVYYYDPLDGVLEDLVLEALSAESPAIVSFAYDIIHTRQGLRPSEPVYLDAGEIRARSPRITERIRVLQVRNQLQHTWENRLREPHIYIADVIVDGLRNSDPESHQIALQLMSWALDHSFEDVISREAVDLLSRFDDGYSGAAVSGREISAGRLRSRLLDWPVFNLVGARRDALIHHLEDLADLWVEVDEDSPEILDIRNEILGTLGRAERSRDVTVLEAMVDFFKRLRRGHRADEFVNEMRRARELFLRLGYPDLAVQVLDCSAALRRSLMH